MIISFIVAIFLIPAMVFASSCDSGAADPTEEDLQQFADIMEAVGMVMEGDPENVEFSETDPEDPEGGTITFNNASYGGVTINGSLNMKITVDYSGTYPIVTFVYKGSLTFSGENAPAETFEMDMTMVVDFNAASFEEALSGSGTITIDGQAFNVAAFLEDIYYWYYYM